jgi:hypothetical protein
LFSRESGVKKVARRETSGRALKSNRALKMRRRNIFLAHLQCAIFFITIPDVSRLATFSMRFQRLLIFSVSSMLMPIFSFLRPTLDKKIRIKQSKPL